MTLREALRKGRNKLMPLGAEDDAELLFLAAFGLDRTRYLICENDPADPEALAVYKGYLERRLRYEPAAYILGRWEFMGFPLRVDPTVLIPRLDTEILAGTAVEEASAHILRQAPASFSMLDLCTGSGCLAIAVLSMVADQCPGACLVMDACDLSEKALKTARTNAKVNKKDINFYQGDLFEAVPNKTYDLIVSNPPYIESDVIDGLDPQVKDYEPRLALDGGKDGLDIYRRIIAEAADHLKPVGSLLMEIGDEQGQTVPDLARKESSLAFVKVVKDLEKRDRVCVFRKEPNV